MTQHTDIHEAEGDAVRRCPECGAPLGAHERCEELFHEALAMEWLGAPETAEAHHLLVATYMLQHPSRYSPEGRTAFRATVIEIVDEHVPAPVLRERRRGVADQSKRDWNFTTARPDAPVLTEWAMTIADVLEGPPEELPQRVWRWGETAR
jgi:hypothetical protein